MKEEVLRIIHGDPRIEPIILLESKYQQLIDADKKGEFLSVLKDLSLHGSNKEQFTSFDIINMIGKSKECEDEIRRIIDRFNFQENANLIPSLLFLCAGLSTDWAIRFIEKIIRLSKSNIKEYSRCFDSGLTSIILTPFWCNYIGEIEWIMGNKDNRYVIDFIAYFKWKRGERDFDELLDLIQSDKPSVYDKVISLMPEIDDRYINNYHRLDLI